MNAPIKWLWCYHCKKHTWFKFLGMMYSGWCCTICNGMNNNSDDDE